MSHWQLQRAYREGRVVTPGQLTLFDFFERAAPAASHVVLAVRDSPANFAAGVGSLGVAVAGAASSTAGILAVRDARSRDYSIVRAAAAGAAAGTALGRVAKRSRRPSENGFVSVSQAVYPLQTTVPSSFRTL